MSGLELELEMIYRLQVRGPLASRDAAAASSRVQYWEMSSATLEGPRLRASSAMPGIDWFTPGDNGYGRPHVRLPFHTHDGALVLLEYRGIVHASHAFQQAVEQGSSTTWEDQYMRMALSFETTSPRYAWLTQHLFVARGRLLAAKEIEYEVYRVK
jgi:hypothetical protein